MIKSNKAAQAMCDDGVDRLVAAIVRSALQDYLRPLPEIDETSKSKKKQEESRKRYFVTYKEKKQAEMFLRESTLMKLTGLSVDYLIQAAKDGKIPHVFDDDEDEEEEEF